jgi:Reverse transcriptase (RNA-dependent DNA polymerase)
VKVNQPLSQPKIVESWQLRTNIAKSQALRSKTVDFPPPRSTQTICKADTSLVEPVLLQDPMPEEAKEHCNHRAYVGDSQSEASTTDNKRERPETIKKRFELWHRRFAHCDPEKLRYLHKVTGLKRRIRIPSSAKRNPCEVCKLSKLRNRIRKELSPWKETILELVSVDACGPLPRTLRGNQYFGQIVDNATRKAWVIPAKDRKDLVRLLRAWKIKVERQTDMQIGAIRIDNAAELKSLLKEWSNEYGLTYEPTVPYKSNQNGVAEKTIQRAEADARAMLIEAKLPIEFWDEAVEADAYLRNRLPGGEGLRSETYIFSPEEAFTGQKGQIGIEHIKVFGCKCYSYVDPKSLPADGRKDKLVPRGRTCVFMGYVDETTKQHKVYAPDLRMTVRSSVIDFEEETKGGTVDLNLPGEHPQGTPNVLTVRKPVGRPKEPLLPVVDLPPREKLNNFEIVIPLRTPESIMQSTDAPANLPSKESKPTGSANPLKSQDETQEQVAPQEQPIPSPQAPVAGRYNLRKRDRDQEDKSEDESKDKITKRIKAMLALLEQGEFDSDNCETAFAVSTKDKKIIQIPIPKSYSAAVADPIYGPEWRAAIQEEIASLQANSTWVEEKVPKGTNLVSTKWVFTVKLQVDGTIERFKARLVARGFSQVYGEDYTETFAPTVRMDTLRIFLAIVAAEDLECRQYDIKNAFTESELQEKIYLSRPHGVPVRSGYALRILRSLYGLKQSARDWNLLAKEFLISIGFQQSLADPCLYVHAKRGIILLLYVDDIAAASKYDRELVWFYSQLSARFNAKDLGEIQKILGVRVTRNRRDRELFIDQEQYLRTVLDRCGFTDAPHRRKDTPLNGYDCLRSAKPEDRRIDVTDYQQAIGSIMYGMVFTRPDIAFATGKLSQYLKEPAECHGTGLKGLLRYIGWTTDLRIRYGPTAKGRLVLYSDADWAGDRTDRKSTSGHVAMLYGGPISWGSRKQTSVATSSTESEYMAMSSCAKQSQWIVQVLKDMGFPRYIGNDPYVAQIKGDNQGALALVKNPHLHERSKHIDIQYHHIRDLEARKRIAVSYIPTTDMVADGMTKPLDRIAFQRFKDLMGMTRKDNAQGQEELRTAR